MDYEDLGPAMTQSLNQTEIDKLKDRVQKLENGMDNLVKFVNENMAQKTLMFK